MKKMPPKGPGGTPKSQTKKARAEAARRQYAVSQLYAGLRTMGHNALVSQSMLAELDFDAEEVQLAFLAYGDK